MKVVHFADLHLEATRGILATGLRALDGSSRSRSRVSMRFAQVKAHDFGPLREQELALAPGMTVVHGENEAGKST